MKKLGLLMMGLLLVGALTACSGDNSQPANNNQQNQQQQGQQQNQQQEQQNNNDVQTVGWKEAASLEFEAGKADGITLDIAELQADPENTALADCNADVQAKMDAWLGQLNEGETLYVNAYVLDTDNYLNVVLVQSIGPNYGSDGDVYSYVYDKTTKTTMDVEYAKAWKALTDEMIIEAITANLTEGQKWRSFNVDAFFVDTDNEPVYLLSAKISQEGADDWTYLYVLKNNQILGNLSGYMEEQIQ